MTAETVRGAEVRICRLHVPEKSSKNFLHLSSDITCVRFALVTFHQLCLQNRSLTNSHRDKLCFLGGFLTEKCPFISEYLLLKRNLRRYVKSSCILLGKGCALLHRVG